MQQPQDLSPDQVRRARVEEKIRYTVSVVSPSGVVTEHVCMPHGSELDGLQYGDTHVRWVNGKPQISLYREREGYRMLEDLCREDGRMDIFQNYKSAIEVRERGGKIAGDVGELYPPSVHRRREQAESGNASGHVFVIGHGVVSGPDAQKDRIKSLLSSAGVKTDDLATESAPAEKRVK
jgi:hypothetical protein